MRACVVGVKVNRISRKFLYETGIWEFTMIQIKKTEITDIEINKLGWLMDSKTRKTSKLDFLNN